MDKKQIKQILRLHKLWLAGDPKGKRADLGGANLWGANLRGANLEGANLDEVKFEWLWINKAALAKSNYIGEFEWYNDKLDYGKLIRLYPRGKYGELLYG